MWIARNKKNETRRKEPRILNLKAPLKQRLSLKVAEKQKTKNNHSTSSISAIDRLTSAAEGKGSLTGSSRT